MLWIFKDFLEILISHLVQILLKVKVEKKASKMPKTKLQKREIIIDRDLKFQHLIDYVWANIWTEFQLFGGFSNIILKVKSEIFLEKVFFIGLPREIFFQKKPISITLDYITKVGQKKIWL